MAGDLADGAFYIGTAKAYYIINRLFNLSSQNLEMSKQVTSFRLTTEDLAALDECAERFGFSRSQVVSFALRDFKENYLHNNGTFVERTPWWFETLEGKTR